MKIQGTIADPISTSGRKYSMHVSSTTHLSFKGHFNNQDVPEKALKFQEKRGHFVSVPAGKH